MSNVREELQRGKTILITGAIGFIGYHLSNLLLKKGMNVIGIDNFSEYYDEGLKSKRYELLKCNRFMLLKIDITDKNALMSVFEKNEIDIVVNLAAQAGVRYSIENPDVYIQTNIVGFFNILECCRYYEIEHLIYASSSSIYGGNTKIPFSVSDKVDTPVSLYAATKKADELMAYTYCKLYNIKATGLRLFTVYGPMGRPDMAYYSFSKKIMSGESIRIYNGGDMYRDFTYIDDVIECIYRIIPNPPLEDINGVHYKIYNIGNNQPEKLMYFIETLEKALGKEAIKEFFPMQPGDVYRTYADVTELEKDFNFKPNTSIETGLKEFAKWFMEYYDLCADE